MSQNTGHCKACRPTERGGRDRFFILIFIFTFLKNICPNKILRKYTIVVVSIDGILKLIFEMVAKAATAI
jgi:hypothetical protein